VNRRRTWKKDFSGHWEARTIVSNSAAFRGMLCRAPSRRPAPVNQQRGYPMFSTRFSATKSIAHSLSIVILGSVALFGQQTPAAPSSAAGVELPVIMRQNVIAGKTPVGTKIQAQLIAATMVNGAVLPKDALLSGEVTQSVKKSGTDPSRLAIRMDSAQWKNGSAPIKVYLTAWFYPEAEMTNQNISYQPADAANSKKNWNGMGPYPDPNNPIAQQKFPSSAGDKDKPPEAAAPASSISKHRVLMKNMESVRDSDGGVVLASMHTNIKLDRLTTYVFATDDLLPRK
jgi:hypothetical protein